MVHEELRAGARALDDLKQQQQNAERQKHIAQRHRPRGARRQRQCEERRGERDVAHQEGDDVVDCERNQKKRKTDHGHRRGLLFKQERTIRFAAGNLLPYSLTEFRPTLPNAWVRLCVASWSLCSGRAKRGPGYAAPRPGHEPILGFVFRHSPDAGPRASGALLIRGPNSLRQDSFLTFRTCRPLYMPVFKSRWWGRRNSPESLSSA